MSCSAFNKLASLDTSVLSITPLVYQQVKTTEVKMEIFS